MEGEDDSSEGGAWGKSEWEEEDDASLCNVQWGYDRMAGRGGGGGGGGWQQFLDSRTGGLDTIEALCLLGNQFCV